MPASSFPDVNQVITEAEKVLRDGAYVAVGLGVLAFQRAQVQRRQLENQLRAGTTPLGDVTVQLSARLDEVARSLAANADETRAQLRDLARSWDKAVAPARKRIEDQADVLQSRLPAPARDVLAGVRAAAAAPEARLRAAVGLD